MGFEQLKSKLAGKEEGYPINEETMEEWANMPSSEKKKLIAEAKEKGGVWRESLLKLNEETLKWSRSGPATTAVGGKKETLITSRENTPEKIAARKALAKDEQALKVASGEHMKDVPKGEGPSIAQRLQDLPGSVKYGAPAALAAGLGAVALAKKMRAAKKK